MFSTLLSQPDPLRCALVLLPAPAAGQNAGFADCLVTPTLTWFNFGTLGGVAESLFVHDVRGDPVRFWLMSKAGTPDTYFRGETVQCGDTLELGQSVNFDAMYCTGLLARTEDAGEANLQIVWQPLKAYKRTDARAKKGQNRYYLQDDDDDELSGIL